MQSNPQLRQGWPLLVIVFVSVAAAVYAYPHFASTPDLSAAGVAAGVQALAAVVAAISAAMIGTVHLLASAIRWVLRRRG